MKIRNAKIITLIMSTFLVVGCGGDGKKGEVSLDSLMVTVPDNISPRAEVSQESIEVVQGKTIRVDATGSSDEDGNIVSYSWQLADGTVISESKVLEYNTASLKAGTYKIRLVVMDDDGATDVKEIRLTINEKPKEHANKYPKVNAGKDKSVTVGQSVDITGTASDTDGKLVYYHWLEQGKLISDRLHFSYKATKVGKHTLTLWVKDDKGAKSSDSMVVTVKEKSKPQPEPSPSPSTSPEPSPEPSPSPSPSPSPNPTSDTTPPVITVTGGSSTSVTQFNTYVDAGATATDDVDGTVSVTTTGSADTDTVGSYTITYTAIDAAGNSATATRTVTVTAFSITHNGTTYGAVKSPYTGKVWLDRNLGAARVCEQFDDSACYGDYYQWGRNFDGHQDSGSGVTDVQATDVNNAGSSFITVSSDPYDWTSVDSDGSQRSANWSKTDGSSVCPVGFSVPNILELKAETLDNGVTNRDTAFSSFLKLPSAGYKSIFDGSMSSVVSYGTAWTTTPIDSSNSMIDGLGFGSGHAGMYYTDRASGLSVRCIKN